MGLSRCLENQNFIVVPHCTEVKMQIKLDSFNAHFNWYQICIPKGKFQLTRSFTFRNPVLFLRNLNYCFCLFVCLFFTSLLDITLNRMQRCCVLYGTSLSVQDQWLSLYSPVSRNKLHCMLSFITWLVFTAWCAVNFKFLLNLENEFDHNLVLMRSFSFSF